MPNSVSVTFASEAIVLGTIAVFETPSFYAHVCFHSKRAIAWQNDLCATTSGRQTLTEMTRRQYPSARHERRCSTTKGARTTRVVRQTTGLVATDFEVTNSDVHKLYCTRRTYMRHTPRWCSGVKCRALPNEGHHHTRGAMERGVRTPILCTSKCLLFGSTSTVSTPLAP